MVPKLEPRVAQLPARGASDHVSAKLINHYLRRGRFGQLLSKLLDSFDEPGEADGIGDSDDQCIIC
jgi:hypothetical protein